MRILVVDDDKNTRQTLTWLLSDEGHDVEACGNGADAVAVTRSQPCDIVFMDLMMPGMSGLEALEQVLKNQPTLKVFMISGQADVATAVRATKLGAYDFLEKPLNPEKVLLEIKKLREQKKANNRIEELSRLVALECQMVGKSPSMQQLRELIQQAAPSDGRILLYGENGTGKELVAREIFNQSPRKNQPFVQLNCAAIPDDLIESELFGHEKGAFTGAYRQKQGLIEQADGGTLLLDEIGDMSLGTQAKLLRVLEENEFYRLGGEKPHRFNVRIISATNKVLSREISLGRFREDLYFRLNVIPITVPPLRERSSDIPLLVEHFMATYSLRNGKKQKLLTGEAVSLLSSYPWPGNIRELKNIMERLAIMTKGDEITASDVKSALGGQAIKSAPSIRINFDTGMSLKERLYHYERTLLQQAYKKYEGNVSRMAGALQTDRANLHKKLKKFTIKN